MLYFSLLLFFCYFFMFVWCLFFIFCPCFLGSSDFLKFFCDFLVIFENFGQLISNHSPSIWLLAQITLCKILAFNFQIVGGLLLNLLLYLTFVLPYLLLLYCFPSRSLEPKLQDKDQQFLHCFIFLETFVWKQVLSFPFLLWTHVLNFTFLIFVTFT